MPLFVLFLLLTLFGHAAAQSPTPAPQGLFGTPIAPEQVGPELMGKDLLIAGRILKVIPASSERAPNRLVMAERGESTLEIVFWPASASLILGTRGLPREGTAFRVRGVLAKYRDNLQIRVESPTQLWLEGYDHLAPVRTPSPRELNRYFTLQEYDTLARLEGTIVSISGEVSDFTPSWKDTAPNIITITGAGRTMAIVYWESDVVAAPNFSQPGTPIFASGRLEFFKGLLQLRVEDVENFSTEPLPAERLAGNLIEHPVRTKSAEEIARAQARPRIDWQLYSPLKAQQHFTEKGSVMIYARSENVPYCREIERMYLLHPDAVDLLGPRTIFFFDVNDPEFAGLGQRLGLVRVPALMVKYRDKPDRVLIFTRETPPGDVYAFMKGS